jgi:hypothetical protein
MKIIGKIDFPRSAREPERATMMQIEAKRFPWSFFQHIVNFAIELPWVTNE